MRYIIIIFTIMFAGLSFAAKQAYVDTDYVIDASLEFKDRSKVLEEKRLYSATIIDGMQAELKNLYEQIKLVSETKQQELALEFEKKREELILKDKEEADILETMAKYELDILSKKTKNAIMEVSKEKKYEIVYDVKAILYLDEKVVDNISQAVLSKMNDNYRKEKSKTSNAPATTSKPATTEKASSAATKTK